MNRWTTHGNTRGPLWNTRPNFSSARRTVTAPREAGDHVWPAISALTCDDLALSTIHRPYNYY